MKAYEPWKLHRDDVVVLFADYKKEMQELIDTYDKLIAQKDEEIERLKKHTR